MKEGVTFILAVVLLLPPAGDAVFCCESSLFGLPKEDTTRNQWLSYIYNTAQNSTTQILECVHCAAHFTEDYFLNLEE